VEIVTGNSEQMKNIVREYINDYGFVCSEGFINSVALIVSLV
jgi:hypothetical protein